LEGALRRLSAEEIEQWFDLELELAIRSQKNKMTTMKTKYGVTNDGRVLGELVVRTAGILSGHNATHDRVAPPVHAPRPRCFPHRKHITASCERLKLQGR
jgi:hypothetical protein